MHKPPLTAKAVFDHALEISSPAERTAYLEQVCADDPELGQKVASLLRAHEEAGSFMDKPAIPVPATRVVPLTVDDQSWTCPPPSSEGLGARIGLYTLVEQLGEGGMGAVYLAEQEQPIRRQVALKIIKPGMDSAQIVARFEAERQALTMMDHPNIARVFDAGATERGRPYFVMELVKGIPMNRFCDENTLTLRERLHLFATVCEAIQHAHQKGVIHRDIKPTNVLVAVQDGKPVPKVIDFGLAKALHEPLIEHAHVTEYGRVVGTLEYMSPEQADSRDAGVDTRADVYSLGVMLYELLTATTPIEFSTLRDEGLTDVVRRIKEDEPPRPSARVSGLGQRLPTIAAERKTEPASLPKLLRGELDWIVLKALEKDRNRRYETVSGFAKDIQHYLDDEPVEACPPSATYRLGKFARKHRTWLALAGFVVGLLVIGVVWQKVNNVRLNRALQSENEARQRAETAAEEEHEGYELADKAIFAVMRSGARLERKEATSLLRTLDRLQGFLREPGISKKARATAAERHFFVGNIYQLTGTYAQAAVRYRTAIQLYEELCVDFPNIVEYRIDLARSNFNLAGLFSGRSEAEAFFHRAIVLHEALVADFPAQRAYRSDLADDHNNLGVHLRLRKEPVKAENAFRKAIVQGETLLETSDSPLYRVNLAASYHNLGNVLRDQRKAEASLVAYGKAIELLASLNIPPRADATLLLRDVSWDRANALDQLGRHAEASQDWQRAISLEKVRIRDYLRLFQTVSQMEEKLKAQVIPQAGLLYETARLNARASTAATATGEDSLNERYAKRALELLKQARIAGYFTEVRRIQQFKADRDFEPLRHDAKFREFVQKLEARKKAD
jgi:serine/threonine protein kinase